MSLQRPSRLAPYEIRNHSELIGCSIIDHRDVGIVAPEQIIDGFKGVLTRYLNQTSLNLHTFTSVEALFEDIKTDKTKQYCFAFEMTDVRPKVNEVNITLFFPRDDLSGILNQQKPLYDLTQKNPDWGAWNRTFMYGTPHFMVYMADSLLMMLRGKRTSQIELAFIPMKTQEFMQLPPFGIQQLSQTFPFFFICTYLVPLYYLVSKLTEEKELRLREGMKMMGMSDSSYFMSWFITNLALTFTVSVLLVLVLVFDSFQKSSFILLITMCGSYGVSFFGVAFALAAVLPNRRGSATTASIFHLLTFFTSFVYKGYTVPFQQKFLLASLVPNCALSYMLDHLMHCEIEGGSGLSLKTAAIRFQHFNFYFALLAQFFCNILWTLVGLYLDQVLQREYGYSRPWNFPCKTKRVTTNSSKISSLIQEKNQTQKVDTATFDNIKSSRLTIKGLRKIYANGKLAVNNIDLTIQKGEIFTLLGHNGAGKTTSLNMLTGLLQPTSGEVSIGGNQLFEDFDVIRKTLGVCPQHNILFDYLTVREHLELFCAIKAPNNDGRQIHGRVEKMIQEIDLHDVESQISMTLSGGQKRKLSVGIALIGESQIIVLDEPTSGMDTTTRRRFWNIINKYKQNRYVLLTTHYLKEADELGDYICIMVDGKIHSSGTCLELKNKFTSGYNLKLQLNSKSADLKSLNTFVVSLVVGSQMANSFSNEVTFKLPKVCAAKLKSLFSALDKQLETFGVLTYQISVISLEDVFLNIGSTIKLQDQQDHRTESNSKITYQQDMDQNQVRNIIWQTKALVHKKLLTQIRDLKSCVIDIFLPCLMVIFGFYLSNLDLVPKNHPVRNLSVYDFPKDQPFLYNYNNSFQESDQIANFIENAFQSDRGENKLWSDFIPVVTNSSSTFFDQIRQLDQTIFEYGNKSFYGQLFFQNVDKENKFYSIAVLANASQPAAALSYANYALQGIIRDQTNNPNFKLNFFEGQLPFSLQWQAYINTGIGVVSSLSIAIAFMMISDTQIQSIIKEKACGSKHLLLISGGSLVAFWFSNFVVDLTFQASIGFAILRSQNIYSSEIPHFQSILIQFTLCNLFFIYVVSYFFENQQKASIFLRVLYFSFGGVAPIAMQVLMVINTDTIEIAKYIKKYFVLIPIYNLNMSYISISNRPIIEMLLQKPKNSIQPLDWECAGESLFMIQFVGVASICIFILAECKVLKIVSHILLRPIKFYTLLIHDSIQIKKQLRTQPIKSIEMEQIEQSSAVQQLHQYEDEDPKREGRRVKNLKNSAVVVDRLHKAYTPFVQTVRGLSFGLECGECFALLGITGAGKTTTFKCLTGEEMPDSGSLKIEGVDFNSIKDLSSYKRRIGFCPQFDALYENLTVYEHLKFYCCIKNIDPEMHSEAIKDKLLQFDLCSYKDVYSAYLSGGNKRKLQCAIALLGSPKIILLDEPTTGVDPQARRLIWSVIQTVSRKDKKSTVILTTHSMDEAEVLSDKLGIMVDGLFKCFGSAQHIKKKYSDGLRVQIQLYDSNYTETDSLTVEQSKNVDQLKQKLQQLFGKCEFVEKTVMRIDLKIVDMQKNTIGFVFAELERLKEQKEFVTYQVNQIQLEEIFNQFSEQNRTRLASKNNRKNEKVKQD